MLSDTTSGMLHFDPEINLIVEFTLTNIKTTSIAQCTHHIIVYIDKKGLQYLCVRTLICFLPNYCIDMCACSSGQLVFRKVITIIVSKLVKPQLKQGSACKTEAAQYTYCTCQLNSKCMHQEYGYVMVDLSSAFHFNPVQLAFFMWIDKSGLNLAESKHVCRAQIKLGQHRLKCWC